MSPVSGGGTVTPISGGGGSGGGYLEQSLPYTLLSLPRYARLLGISPPHFMTAFSYTAFPAGGGCDDIWFKYDWQDSDKVSRESLAYLIAEAEQEVASFLGWWPAPVFLYEQRSYPSMHRPEYFGTGVDVRGLMKSVPTTYGKIISLGKRAVSLIGTAATLGGSLQYTDEDSDGLYETAIVQLPTTETNVCELKLYTYGKEGDIRWEIRPVRSKTISGGVVQFILDSWLLIDPILYEEYPTENGPYPIDISTTANFVTSVDVYREYVDTINPSVLFQWESAQVCQVCGGVGCDVCELLTQDGCGHVRDAGRGAVVPYPATYNSDTGAWNVSSWTYTREPDMLQLWYYAGNIDNSNHVFSTCEPLSDYFAKVIAWLATARLERPLCGCSNVEAVAEDLRKELTESNREISRFLPEDVLTSPFGTRKGEVMAWRRLKRLVKDRKLGHAVI